MTLAPYVPGRDGPFARDEASHLLRRAGFSATVAELDGAVRAGLAATLEQLFLADEGKAARQLAATAPVVTQADDLSALQALWFGRMVATRAPAVEKLALFLHGHFATSFEKVARATWMWQQYALLRENGAGSFRDLLQAISRDPAMLLWLDSNSNEKGLPNENYARELMELFSLGVGHYSERDVQEAARAFSGWHVKDGRFWLNPRAHDAKEKTVLGCAAPLDGGDVVDLCASHAECPRFLARKLLRFYVEPEPAADAVEELATALVEEQLQLAPVLRRLFGSQRFFAEAARRAVIAGPVEWCVGLLRKTGARVNFRAAAAAAAAMGQSLFAPPNVKGWDGDRAWISSQALLERVRFAEAMAYGDGEVGVTIDWERVAGDAAAASAAGEPGGGERLVVQLSQRLIDGALLPETTARIAAFAQTAEAGTGETRVRRVAQLVLSAPEALLI